MADMSHIARPYANAVFELAKETQSIQQWSDVLSILASTLNEAVAEVISDPQVERGEVVDFFQACLADKATESSKNFLLCLAEHDRFLAIPEMYRLYETLKSEEENQADVVITSSSELSQSFIDAVKQKLKSRFESDIKVHTKIDAALIGGAVIEAGDLVIDGSVKGKLARLSQSILA